MYDYAWYMVTYSNRTTLYVTSTLQRVHFVNFNIINDIHFIIPLFGNNNKIINLYFNCKGKVSTSVLPFYVTIALHTDGCN